MNNNFLFTDFGVDLWAAISAICEVLDIEEPGICIDEKIHFPTKTTMALADMQENNLFLNPSYFSPSLEFGPLQLFVLAHELRHIYQFKNGVDFKMYKSRKNTSLKEYNIQPEDIDAYAFGFLFVDSVYDDDNSFLLSSFIEDAYINTVCARMEEIMDKEPELYERLFMLEMPSY